MLTDYCRHNISTTTHLHTSMFANFCWVFRIYFSSLVLFHHPPPALTHCCLAALPHFMIEHRSKNRITKKMIESNH